MAHDVFISYSSEDKRVADAVCAKLESAGVRCWIAPRDVLPGMSYGHALIEAIEGSRVVVLVLSTKSSKSQFVTREVERAVSKAIPIVPLRIEDVTLSGDMAFFIPTIHWLDALTPPLETHLDKLSTSVQALLKAQTGWTPAAQVAGSSAIAAYASAPATSPVQTVTPQAPGSKKGSLLALSAVLVLVLIGAGAWIFWPKPPEPHTPARIINQPTPAPNPEVAPTKPVNPVAKTTPQATRMPSQDPFVGSWNWFTGGVMVIRGDGTAHWGNYGARWQLVDPAQRTYVITWPNAIQDTLTMSADGRRVVGQNQFGIKVSGARIGH